MPVVNTRKQESWAITALVVLYTQLIKDNSDNKKIIDLIDVWIDDNCLKTTLIKDNSDNSTPNGENNLDN